MRFCIGKLHSRLSSIARIFECFIWFNPSLHRSIWTNISHCSDVLSSCDFFLMNIQIFFLHSKWSIVVKIVYSSMNSIGGFSIGFTYLRALWQFVCNFMLKMNLYATIISCKLLKRARSQWNWEPHRFCSISNSWNLKNSVSLLLSTWC